MEPPHSSGIEEIARGLGSDPSRGLTERDAADRLQHVGPNLLRRAERPPYLSIAARQFADPLVALLIVAAGVSLVIGEAVEAAAIGAIVLLNAVLGFVQEARAERDVLALRAVLAPHASVVRAGHERDAPAEEVVPGDVVVLREGARVPADGRIVASAGLAVDESALTGESIPVDKGERPVDREAPLAERSSMAYAGTAVTRGRGRLLVTATGHATELGEIAALVGQAASPPTPLERRIRSLARVMVGLGVVVTVALAGAMVARDASAHEAFLVGISVAVAAVPEGLAATVTIALALGARTMASRGAIVRRLAAVETLGSATVIASDKTGTLTENRLRLRTAEAATGHDESALLAGAALASTARVLEGEERLVGDPVDAALVLAAHERGLTRAALMARRRLVRELPFDAERRRMALVYEEDGTNRIYVKGAPEVVLERAAIDAEEARRLTERAERWAADGLRVLAVAERAIDDPLADEEVVERRLDVVGLVGLDDPLRPAARAAVATALAAGLRVEMLTGDHPVTARALGRMLGLPDAAIHARITPAEKLRLVERLQAEGEVVAVTGDGVNDAPALKRADVGVAMGSTGTEAAREASDLVLTDDDFATIVAAIREGRAITDNIRKFVAFLLSANLGEVALFAVAIPVGLGAPLTVVQVLLINVLTDGLPAVALARDPAAPGTMQRPPETSSRLFPRRAWVALAAIGALVGTSALAAFLIGRDDGDATAATMAFVTIALAELALVFTVRSPVDPAWTAPRNRALLGSVVLSAAVVGLAVYLPPLHDPLGTVALDGGALALAAVLALVPAVCIELVKAVLRRAGWSLEPGRLT